MQYIKWMDNLPKGIKVVLAILFEKAWIIYRLVKSVERKKTGQIVLLAILQLLIVPIIVIWIMDMITLSKSGKVLWFNEEE
ncbi:MAG: hypothetical protein ACOX28_02315 [Bacilli bacterium]|jgi:hypothetical protein